MSYSVEYQSIKVLLEICITGNRKNWYSNLKVARWKWVVLSILKGKLLLLLFTNYNQQTEVYVRSVDGGWTDPGKISYLEKKYVIPSIEIRRKKKSWIVSKIVGYFWYQLILIAHYTL